MTATEPRNVVRREMLRFLIPGLIGMVVLTGLSLAASVAVAREQSMQDAELTALFLARSVVQPRLTQQVLAGRPGDVAALDSALATTAEGSDILGLRIWDADGVVVYANDPRVIGETFDLGPLGAEFAPGAAPMTGPADTSRPENRYLDPEADIVDVTVPLTGADGQTYVFQVHQLQDQIREQARTIWWSFVPVLVGSLLLMGLLLGMLAVRMAGRISDDLAHRQELLQRSLQAGDVERRRIAADLHDGTVQELAGLSFTLAGLSSRAAASGDTTQSEQLAAAATQARDAVREMRSLLVDIYPPNLERTGLTAALTDLGATAEVDVTATDLPGLDPELQTAIYRIAREAVANATKHAAAGTIAVTLDREGSDVVLRVSDDGDGFVAGEREPGHMGLTISEDVAAAVGGDLVIDSAPRAGTTVTFRVEEQ